MRGLFLALTLTGCATAPTYHHWYKPNVAQHEQEFNADWYECVKENVNDNMAVQCMKARGYQLAWSDDSGENGLPRQAPADSTAH
jgi:hypothetical protein